MSRPDLLSVATVVNLLGQGWDGSGGAACVRHMYCTHEHVTSFQTGQCTKLWSLMNFNIIGCPV